MHPGVQRDENKKTERHAIFFEYDLINKNTSDDQNLEVYISNDVLLGIK